MSFCCNGPGGALSAPVRALVYFPTILTRQSTNDIGNKLPLYIALDWKEACKLADTKLISLVGRAVPYDTSDAALLSHAAYSLANCLSESTKVVDNNLLSIQIINGISIEIRDWLGNYLLMIMQAVDWQVSSTSGWFPALLRITSLLERFLGDLVITMKQKHADVAIPFLLRDFLLVPSLVQLLGHDLIFLLRLLIGPPTGMNVRNIAWHGFLDASFNDCGRCYTVLLLAVFIKIAKCAHPQLDHIKCRPLANLSNYYDYAIQLAVTNSRFDIKHSMDLIERVIPGTSTLWYPSNYSDGRSVDQQLRTVISTLPLIEHGLRRYWVDCNQLPIERCCTANSTQFYSILDDILASPIRLNEDTPPRCNLIADRLTESVTNFLMDLFLYSRGPRLRDRLAHGELSWLNDNVSSSDIEPFVRMVEMAFESVLSIITSNNQSNTFDIVPVDYQSHFHPLISLKEAINIGKTCIYQLIDLEVETIGQLVLREDWPVWLSIWEMAPCHTLWRPPIQVRLATSTLEPLVRSIIVIIERLYDSLSIGTCISEDNRGWSTRKRRQYAQLVQLSPSIIHPLWCLICAIVNWLSAVGAKSSLTDLVLADDIAMNTITEPLARQLRKLVDQCQSHAVQGHWERAHNMLTTSPLFDRLSSFF